MHSVRKVLIACLIFGLSILILVNYYLQDSGQLGDQPTKVVEERINESKPTIELNGTSGRSKIENDMIGAARDNRIERTPDGQILFRPTIELSRTITRTTSAEEAIGHLHSIFGQYRFAFQTNPVGVENSEFTAQLLGSNPKGVTFIARDSKLLLNGELVDPWNTPYFFHPLSSTELEIVSAGEDRQLWTRDDIGQLSEAASL